MYAPSRAESRVRDDGECMSRRGRLSRHGSGMREKGWRGTCWRALDRGGYGRRSVGEAGEALEAKMLQSQREPLSFMAQRGSRTNKPAGLQRGNVLYLRALSKRRRVCACTVSHKDRRTTMAPAMYCTDKSYGHIKISKEFSYFTDQCITNS